MGTYDPRLTMVLSLVTFLGVMVWAPILAQRRWHQEAAMRPDGFSIRMPRWYVWAGAVLAVAIGAIGVVAVLSVLFSFTTSNVAGTIAAIVCGVLAWLMVMFALYAGRWEVRVDHTTITVRGLFHRPRSFPASAVSRAKVRMLPGPRLTIYVGGRRVVSVESTQVGYTRLVQVLSAAGVPWDGPGQVRHQVVTRSMPSAADPRDRAVESAGWAEAGIRLAQDPHAQMLCPACSRGTLRAGDILDDDGCAVERWVFCPTCGARNYLRLGPPQPRQWGEGGGWSGA